MRNKYTQPKKNREKSRFYFVRPKYQIGDILVDNRGIYHKCVNIPWYCILFERYLYSFDTGKYEYEDEITKNWSKTNLEHKPGEQIKLF